ncbi:AAA family ATPase [Flavobacterium sp. F-65]|uniref:AAA family ATPase n=1 Tax=Flavobacterium pisciphilum TaxID=2893755 RepID=A0ABS8MQU1_9FLAO|nr:ATP-binding protein [Flavobacterium sp. F-65]MCC9071127.1 AAA family ATPase [Flavobacterium sp. F-65]
MRKGYDLIFPKSEDFNDYFLNDEDYPITFLPRFNTINIIVGANNSGKSRFVRNLMCYTNFNAVPDFHVFRGIINTYNKKVIDVNKIINSKISSFEERSKTTRYVDGSTPDKDNAEILRQNKPVLLDEDKSNDFLSIIYENKEKLENIFSLGVADVTLIHFREIDESFFKVYKVKNYFIPTLRTAHSLFNFEKERYSKIEEDIYLDTLHYYYDLKEKKVEIFTGIHLYKEILNTRNSRREIRNKFDQFEDFIRFNFFDGKKIDIVAEFDKDESLKGNNNLEIISVHVEGEKETRSLYELGDGIQALIILMYKIFMAEDNSFIYIDEPELNLHPGMQRLFLEQITSNKDLKKKNLTYILTTHSNHFLDLTIEKDNVSIYSFSPRNNELNDKQFTVKNVNRGNNSLLKELGVNNSSVFMANCSIWVEGISDRNYIKAFLKSYCDSIGKSYPKEDIDFAFFEYAGSNVDHYIFEDEIEDEKKELLIKDIKSLALSNRIFLLADSDAVTKTKNKQKFVRLETLKNAESDNFKPKIIWDVREIENLLTNDIWKKVLINFCNEKLVNQYEAEIQNKIELALGKIDANKLKKEYIGNFLNDLREEISKKGNVYILNKSFYEIKKNGTYGTIIDKRGLSEKVFEADFPWTVFSKNKEIKNLTIEIYDFITKKP